VILSGMNQTATAEDARPMLTPAEIAELANVSRRTVYREIERGSLPALHVGRLLRIDPDEFRHYLARERAVA
jgi:excisionase family DNA binding protein